MKTSGLQVARKPLVHLTVSTPTRMWLISFCAGIAIIQSSLTDSFASLGIALAAVAGAVITELVIDAAKGTLTLLDGSAVTSALVFTLLLPHDIHPAIAAIGMIFAIGVIKQSFGGLGTNWLNPAVGGWLLVRFSWPEVFATSLKKSPLFIIEESLRSGIVDPSGSPLAILKIAGYKESLLDKSITDFLNSNLFSIFNAELPAGYIDFLNFSGSGIIADRGSGCLLLGTIVIIACFIYRHSLSMVFLGTYLVLVRLFGAIPFGGTLGNGDMLFALFTGATIPGAFILSSDPATSTKSFKGGIIVSLLLAILTFAFRYPGHTPYGMIYAIALMNVFVPLIRHIEGKLLYRARRIV